MKKKCDMRPRLGLPFRARFPALFGVGAFALAAFLALVLTAPPAFAIEDRIQKLREEKKEIESQLSGLRGRPEQLEKVRDEYIDTYDYLKRQQIRLQGFQLWNAFVAFMSVAHDSIQKVNPGNSVVVATATFVQDRVGGAMDNPPLQAKIRSVSEAVMQIGPALTRLDYALNMNQQQVADLLHTRRMVDNTWRNRWSRNPEDTALSRSVITGKITFIQERLGPAATAIYKAKLELDGTIPLMYGQIKALEERIKSIDTNIGQLERHLALNEVLKAAREIENPPTVDVSLWPREAKAYGAAYASVIDAWNDLKSNSINGTTYNQLKRKAYNDASAYRWEQTRPYSERVRAARDYYWNDLLPRMRRIEDLDAKRRMNAAGHSRINAAAEAYWGSVNREAQAYKNEFADPMQRHDDTERAEAERWLAFARRIDNLLETQVDFYRISVRDRSIERDMIPLRRVGLGGASLARAASATNSPLGWINSRMNVGPNVGSLGSATQSIADWEKQRRELADFARALYSTGKSSQTAFSGFASEIDGLANELGPNRSVWDYMGWARPGSGYIYSASSLFSQMNMAMTIYNFMSSTSEDAARQVYDEILEKLQQAQAVKNAMQGADAVLSDVEKLYELKREAYSAYFNVFLDRAGSHGRNFLFYTRVTNDEADAIFEFVNSLTSEEEIENHLFAARSYVWEEARRVPRTIEALEALQKRYETGDNAAANAYNRYQSAYNAYNSLERSIESRLSGMRSRIVPHAPGLTRLLYLEAVLQEVVRPFYHFSWTERRLYNWYPVDSQDLAAGWPAAGPVFERLKAGRRAYEAKIASVQREMEEGFPKRAARIDAITRQLNALAQAGSISSEAAFRNRIESLREQVNAIYNPLAERLYLSSSMAVVGSYRRFNNSVYWAYSRMRHILERDRNMEEFSKLLAEAGLIISRAPSSAGLDQAGAMIATLGQHLRSNSMLSRYASADEPGAKALLEKGQDMVTRLNTYIQNARQAAAAAITAQVQDFYRTFARTYESRNASALVNLMDRNWSAPDGSDLFDVEEMLDNSFMVFDRVEYKIQNLSVSPRQDGSAVVSYDVTIVGRILRQDLVHEEKTKVTDVLAKENGRWRIVRTMGGQFWR